MPRLYLFAEGQTEQAFADNVIKPHLAFHSVFLQNTVLIAHAKKKGVVHRGGGEELSGDEERYRAVPKTGTACRRILHNDD